MSYQYSFPSSSRLFRNIQYIHILTALSVTKNYRSYNTFFSKSLRYEIYFLLKCHCWNYTWKLQARMYENLIAKMVQLTTIPQTRWLVQFVALLNIVRLRDFVSRATIMLALKMYRDVAIVIHSQSTTKIFIPVTSSYWLGNSARPWRCTNLIHGKKL